MKWWRFVRNGRILLTNKDTPDIMVTDTNKRGIFMIYKQKEFADLIKVSTRTLTRWDKDGKFPARTNPSGHKFYTEDDLQRYLSGEEVILTESEALLILLEMSEDDSEWLQYFRDVKSLVVL